MCFLSRNRLHTWCALVTVVQPCALPIDPRFRSGNISTHFIAEELPNGFAGTVLPDDRRDAMLAVAALVHVRNEFRARHLGGKLGLPEWQPGADWIAFLGKAEVPLTLSDAEGGRSEARRVGKEGVSTCRSRWSPDH